MLCWGVLQVWFATSTERRKLRIVSPLVAVTGSITVMRRVVGVHYVKSGVRILHTISQTLRTQRNEHQEVSRLLLDRVCCNPDCFYHRVFALERHRSSTKDYRLGDIVPFRHPFRHHSAMDRNTKNFWEIETGRIQYPSSKRPAPVGALVLANCA